MKNMIVKLLRLIEKFLSRVIGISGLLAGVFIVMIMLLTVSDVFMRYFFSKPIVGCSEICEYFMVSLAALSLAWCALNGGHISVDIVVSRFSKRTQNYFDIFNYVIAVVLCLFVVSQTYAQSAFVRKLNAAGMMTGIPQYPFYLVVTFGYLLLFLAAVMLLIHLVVKVVKR